MTEEAKKAQANRMIGRRRRTPRRAVDFNVGLLVKGEYHITRAYEIGEGGMLVGFKDDLEVGQKVVLSYHLDNLLQQVVRGEVRYIAKDVGEDGSKKYGIQFNSVDFETKRKIRSYVAASTTDSRQTKAS